MKHTTANYNNPEPDENILVECLKLFQKNRDLQELGLDNLTQLAVAVTEHHYQPDDIIIQEGNNDRVFHFIISGRVLVWQSQNNTTEELVNEHTAGSYIGEIALLEDSPRTATCQAVTDVITLALTEADFDRLLRPHFEELKQSKLVKHHLQLLSQLPKLWNFPLDFLEMVAQLCQEVHFEANAIIRNPTQETRELYVVVQGLVGILNLASIQSYTSNLNQAQLQNLKYPSNTGFQTYYGQGDLFGSMIGPKPLGTGWIVAVSDCRLLVIPIIDRLDKELAKPQFRKLFSQSL